MSRPLIGVISNGYLIDDQYPAFGNGIMNFRALADAADATGLMIPADPELVDIDDLMSRVDGILLTGGRANVHPEEYGEEPTEAHGQFDRGRDRVVLPLIRACVDRGMPVLGVCRGFQEMNVAFGGSLYPEIRDLPGRMNHRMPPDGTLKEKFALRHDVTFTENGVFHRLMGQQTVLTNTLHGQGIKQAGDRIVIDGLADDGTPEAIYVKDAPGFALGTQWHPEWNAGNDTVSRPLFGAFGDAARAWAGCKSQVPGAVLRRA